MNSPKERLLWLDLAKGIGIILVVMGHTLFPLHQAINIFHMPLFFILAGVTFRPAMTENFLLKKIDSFYIPFVFFTLISLPISYLVPHEGGFNGPLWFLQTLFVVLILIQLAYRLCDMLNASFDVTGGVILVLSAIAAVLMLHCSDVVLPFDIYRAVRALPFILLGYLLKRLFIGTEQINKNWLLFAVAFVIYGIALCVA